MQQKTMKQVITKKIAKWLESIQDLVVINAIKKDLIITGGCFPSMISNEEINDFDCYFRTKETTLLVANYYADLWNEKDGHTRPWVVDCDDHSISTMQQFIKPFDDGRVRLVFKSKGVEGNPEEANGSEELGVKDVNSIVEELDEIKADDIIKQVKEPFMPVFISSNAITLSDKIQIIVRFFGEPDRIHETFDFVHTKAYYDYGFNKLVIPNEVYEMVTNKILKYTGSKHPVCSLFRLRKFIARGWTINAGQILKIALQISDLDLEDVDVLEDQLIGVDSLYFMDLIDRLRAMGSQSNFELTKDYLVSILDKIF